MADLVEVERTTAGKKIRNMIAALVSLRHHFVRMPETAAAVNAFKRQFYEIAGFPGVIGAIDCTHVPILCPGSTDAELYRNRKGFVPINVQAICDARYASPPSAINAPLLLGADKYGPAPPPAPPRPALVGITLLEHQYNSSTHAAYRRAHLPAASDGVSGH